MSPAEETSGRPAPRRRLVCVATSIHPDYDARVFRHARAVAEMGYEVDLVCPWTPAPHPAPPTLRLVTFERVRSRAKRAWLIPRRMLPLLLARPYDLYHFHDIDILPLFAALGTITRRPVVYDCHENYADEMMYRRYPIPSWTRPFLATLVRWSERAAALLVREVVTVVPEQADTFRSPWFRPVLVRNFTERSLEGGRIQDYESRGMACISLGSQYVENGSLLLLDIARHLVGRRPDLRFYCVDRFGADPGLRDRVVRQIGSPDLRGSVEMLPFVHSPQLMTHLNRARIGLALDLEVPARLKALPMKLFDYMAAGIPIVAADLPNARRIIESTNCGLLVKPGDASAFVRAIERLLENPLAAADMGLRGLEAFRSTYNWETEVAKLRPVYERLTARR